MIRTNGTGSWMRRMCAVSLVVLAAFSLGCATYHGTASAAQPAVVAREGQWIMVPRFPLVMQPESDDCGAAALSAVLRYWGYPASPASIETAIGHADRRLSAGDMEAHAQSLGLHSYVFSRGTMKDILRELEQGRPVIVGLGKMVDEKKALSHYEVVVGYEPQKKQVLLLDPARGWQVDSLEGFAKEWAISNAVTMVALPGSRAAGEVATGAPTLRADEQAYASREAASPDAKKYKAGDVIVISATTLVIILLVVLIIILI